ncbi:MAG: hypothetical protein HY681_07840, partial [Chloroflexi bacterium]|nr:hypothetical protein [Chloroflexota bacterium]
SYTAPDGTVGTPYILARGEKLVVISDIKLEPVASTNPVGSPHTLTAIVTEDEAPLSGTTVTFKVLDGPNKGLIGTGMTNAGGKATFTYSGTVVGKDFIVATFVDSTGATQSSSVVSKEWVEIPELTLTATPKGCPPIQVVLSPNPIPGLEPSAVVTMDETITVPSGTPHGVYSCVVEFAVNGVVFAVQSITIMVPNPGKVEPPLVTGLLNAGETLEVEKKITVPGGGASPGSATYTLNADFDKGVLINVDHDVADQLQLDDTTKAFPFVWVAASGRGTIIKIDAVTGAIKGEYWSSPDGMARNPSRTTVDKNGSVWAGNRDEGGWVEAGAIAPGVPAVSNNMGSVVRIGLVENGQCKDRNGNGIIDTSTGLGDIRPWTNAGGVNSLGGVSTAADECVVNYTRVNEEATRHVSVDKSNDVWVGGLGSERAYDKLNGLTGAIVRQEPGIGCGGYGGLITKDGVIWSARDLLRWDTSLPLTDANSLCYNSSEGEPAWHDSYGLCIDSLGNVWNTALGGNQIRKFAPDGTLLGVFSHGNENAQGCAVDGNNQVWVAHSLFGATTVGHVLNDGTLVGVVPLPTSNGPTGVSVDAAGKVWVANINSNSVSRIDPNAGPLGCGGTGCGGGVHVGAVNLEVDLGPGASPYNYSDMTGSILVGAPTDGSWTVVHDSGKAGTDWGSISWNASTPGDSAIVVRVSSSADGVAFGPESVATNGGPIVAANNRYLKVTVFFKR